MPHSAPSPEPARVRPLDKLFSADELEKREKLAEQIVTDIVKREKTDELSDLAKELKITVFNNLIFSPL